MAKILDVKHDDSDPESYDESKLKQETDQFMKSLVTNCSILTICYMSKFFKIIHKS